MICGSENFCTFAVGLGFPKRETFFDSKNKKLSKTENFNQILRAITNKNRDIKWKLKISPLPSVTVRKTSFR